MKIKVVLPVFIIAIVISITLYITSFRKHKNISNLRSKNNIQQTRYIASYNASKSKERLLRGHPDMTYITLNPNIKTRGIINELGRDSEYVQRLFGLILQYADKISKGDMYEPDGNKNIFRNYYAFLLASLVVPYHESGLVHIRRRKYARCSDVINNTVDPLFDKDFRVTYLRDKINHTKNQKKIIKLKHKLEYIKIVSSIRKKLYRFEYKLPFPNCNKLTKGSFNQMRLGGADFGLMMVNFRSHPDYFTSGDVWGVNSTITYGISHLYKGFKKISFNSKRYKCLKGLERRNRFKYAEYLIKGAWTGNYNSGSVRKTCRFLDDKSKFNINDIGFSRHLKQILKRVRRGRKGSTPYHRYLPWGSLERKAFLELVDNVKRQVNHRKYIEQVLTRDYHLLSIRQNDTPNQGFNLHLDQNLDFSSQNQNMSVKDTVKSLYPEHKDLRSFYKNALSLISQNNENASVNKNKFSFFLNQRRKKNEKIKLERQLQALDDLEPYQHTMNDVFQKQADYYVNIISIKSLNIRSRPSFSNTLCGNSRRAETQPVIVHLLPFRGKKFVRISANGIRNLIKVRKRKKTRKCLEQDEYYISKKYVTKAVNPKYVIHLQFKILENIWAYDKSSIAKGRKVQLLLKGEGYKVFDKIILKYSNKIWYKIMTLDGNYAWVEKNKNIKIIE